MTSGSHLVGRDAPANDDGRWRLEAQLEFEGIIGRSSPMREIFRIVEHIADKEATALILGESGTGKELVARAIHRRSARRCAPFVPVNCSAIPAGLVEAEFFGYERGAFTDARGSYAGKFEQAHTGTLFLDEIGDLALDAQAKLLRVLQDREVTRLGGRKLLKVDVRILAATNKSLDTAIITGHFREDLYWRLNVVTVVIPPLRERREDIPILVDAFIHRIARQTKSGVKTIAADAMQILAAQDWPGNVRQLENCLERAIVLCDGCSLHASDVLGVVADKASRNSAPPLASERSSLIETARQAAELVERDTILTALSEHRGHRAATAASLGINRKTLFRKMRLYGMASK